MNLIASILEIKFILSINSKICVEFCLRGRQQMVDRFALVFSIIFKPLGRSHLMAYLPTSLRIVFREG